ncbi:MAG: nuclear transport factor 2 family protein [Sphingomonadales bacterium]|nr:nuclear transport factor 2 family protein [Sphingomonadales bacterium]
MKTIEDVLAEAEIRDVHIRYCRANDRRDEALMRGCFHPDAVIELHQPFDVEGFLALGRQILGQYVVTWHNTGNQLVEVKGDAAWAEHYTISSHRIAATEEAPARDWIAHGRYIDRMERRGGEWRIARRRMVVDYTRMDPVAPGGEGLGTGGGARDLSDPSYAMRLVDD